MYGKKQILFRKKVGKGKEGNKICTRNTHLLKNILFLWIKLKIYYHYEKTYTYNVHFLRYLLLQMRKSIQPIATVHFFNNNYKKALYLKP